VATAPARRPTGITGASVARADLGTMREAIEAGLGIDLGRLGQMVGSLSATLARLRGSLAVELR